MKTIFKIEKLNLELPNGNLAPITIVWYGSNTTETRSTWKTRHISVKCYFNNSKKFVGHDARCGGWNRPEISVFKKTMKSKFDRHYKSMRSRAIREAYLSYLSSLKDLPAVVQYFDRTSGNGQVFIPSLNEYFRIDASSLKNAKSWWANLACTYLIKGEKITVSELARVEHGLVATARNDGHFDAEAWERVKKGNHSFTQRDDGSMSGLFADKKGA